MMVGSWFTYRAFNISKARSTSARVGLQDPSGAFPVLNRSSRYKTGTHFSFPILSSRSWLSSEKFFRGDSSRNTEGSGLGLSIAKSLTELQGGMFTLEIDGDLFKATLTFDLLK